MNAPIFVIGSPRSGTSVLSKMLNSHPNIGIPYETKIIDHFWNLEAAYQPLSDPQRQRELLRDMMSIRNSRFVRPHFDLESAQRAVKTCTLAGVIEALMGSWTQAQGKTRWGEKTPGNVLHLSTVLRWFPDATFIHIVRDGRDVASSLIAAPFGPKTHYTAALRWRRFVDICDAFSERVPATRLHTVSYERLLADPANELTKICCYLKEEYHPSMLQFHLDAMPYPTDKVNAANLLNPLKTENHAKWKRNLKDNQLEIIERVAGPTLQRHGYALATGIQSPPSKLEAFLRRKVEPVPLKTLAMARNVSGQREALNKLRLRAKGALRTAFSR